ncbi:MAG TPA: LysR family transcriptional regulator [Polyangiaceae bacterium]|nr:LysR family transcriptional regulator [Polyangiaceae bacterium]
MAGGTSLDWSLVQAFLAVSEVGSLSAAARVLGSSQPTVGRQIHAMEEQLGAELFQRHDKGLTLTETGEAMLPPARAMRQAIHEIELRAAGKAETLEGAVRITSSVVVGTEHLPRIVARIRREEPRIEIELHVSDETSNLHFREADIAVRLYRPTQLDLVTQHLGDLRFAAFAAKSYVERRGLPRRPEDLLAHDVVGMDRETAILEGFRQAGFPVEREWFKVRADNPIAYWQLVRAGAGIGFGQVLVGARDPELVEIPLGLDLPTYPVWLTAHEAVRHAPRVARVWELLAEELRATLAR